MSTGRLAGMTGLGRAALVGSVMLAAGCADGPAERFRESAAPVLEARCAGAACHGVRPEQAWPAIDGLFFRIDDAGRLVDLGEARAMALRRVSTHAPRASTLVRVPMPRSLGGGPHAGGALFTGPDDDALDALLSWIESEPSGGEDLALDALEQQFGREVAPVLIERCARDGCHGSADVAFAAFGLHPASDGTLSDLDVRNAHGALRPFLDLAGSDPARSRLVRKAIGGDSGGLVHRGNASTLFPEAPIDDPLDAPGLDAILRWARAEREALGVHEGHAPSGVIYVDGPEAKRAPYRIEPGPLGSELVLASWPSADTQETLTASLHPEGPVEIRDPAISHDAARVAFAMRREGEARFAIWEMTLATREARRVTREGDGSFVQPTYAPDGRIVAAWDGHGELASDGPGVAPELVAIDREGALERLTYTPAPEVSPAFLAAGKTRGEVLFAARREPHEGVLFRFPLCHDPTHHGEPEYHVQLGATLAPEAPILGRDLPDGRQIAIVISSTDADDDRGMLAVLDRSLGPQLAVSSEASVGGYRSPIAWLDRAPRFRDPAPLPDGRVLVVVDGSILIARIDDREDGAHLGALEPYLEGTSLRSPVPVVPRPPEDDGHAPITDPSHIEGVLALRDVAVLESIYGRAAPRGARGLRDGIVTLRLLASERAPASEVRRYDDGGTTVGLSRRIPTRVLDEIELPSDRSAYLAIPAGLPMRLALVDADGMEIGRALDRYYYAEGGEMVPGGTNTATYAHDCAGCHGAASGDPRESAGAVPDAISSASITLSTHEARDPRRPLAPRAVGPGDAVDFVRTLASELSTRCASSSCHGGLAPAANLALDDRAGSGRFPAAYEGLARFVDLEGLRARRSALVERLVGRELEADTAVTGSCPPGGADDALVRAVARWIEAGAFYDLSRRERERE